ncbi:MAG: energy transducer TonB [Ignavibacteriales bacterium]|nr:energy transducer TonB [Ignavibacteriales bacterium]
MQTIGLTTHLKRNYRFTLEVSSIFVLLLLILVFKFYPFSKSVSQSLTSENEYLDAEDVIELLDKREEESLPQKPETKTLPKLKKDTPVTQPVLNKEIEVTLTPPKEKVKLESQDIDKGDLLTLDKQGKFKDKETYKKTTEKDGKAKGPKDNTYYTAVPYMPVPIGGFESIQSKAIFPQAAKDAGISGTVYITAFIDELGNVNSVVLTKGIHPACDNSALSAVRRTKFSPGKKDGKPVKVQMLIPVTFK